MRMIIHPRYRADARLSLATVLLVILVFPEIVRSAIDPSQAARSQAAAGAQPALPEVTVVAPKPPDAQQIAGDNVATFVRSHGKPGKRTGQLGRWDSAICASTLGLTKGFTDFVSARIEAIAAAVHLPQRKAEACKPNVLIIFTPEPQKFLNDVVKHRPQWLGFHYMVEIARLATVDHPIQAWYVTGSRGAAGNLEVDDIWGGQPPRTLGSRLSMGVSSYIIFALVVVDMSKVTDYPIGPISDYVGMMSLSQTQLNDGCGELPSILDLMAQACKSAKSDSITGGDIAYLRALYSIDPRTELSLQRSAIENIMMQEFAGH